MELRRLRESFLEGPSVDRGGYEYFVNPLSDGLPRVDRELLDEAVSGILEVADLDCDVILAPEAMALPIAAGITLRAGIPYLAIRKRPYGLPGEISFGKRTGYSESMMHVSTLRPGERVAIVDDVLDTGGTARATVDALRGAGIVVTEIVAVFDRNPDRNALSAELGVPIKALLRVGVEDGRPVVRERRYTSKTLHEVLTQSVRFFYMEPERAPWTPPCWRYASRCPRSNARSDCSAASSPGFTSTRWRRCCWRRIPLWRPRCRWGRRRRPSPWDAA